MKRTIHILLLLIFSGQLFACGGAFQYRLFPIGIAKNKLISIETSLMRYWGPDTPGTTVETRDRWKGSISLISINEKGKLDLIELIDSVDILDRDYCIELKPFFDIAIQKAMDINDFIVATDVKIEFCNFKKDCKTIDLTGFSTEIVNLKDANSKYLVKIPDMLIENSKFSVGMTNQDFKINSIREMTIGKSKILIVNIASGEENNTDFDKQIENQKECEKMPDCIYKEITLYHGLAFDAIVWK